MRWLLWLIFPRCILAAGRGPRQGDAYALARSVKARLQRWQAGEYSQLWAEAVQLTLPPVPAAGRNRRAPPPPVRTQEERNVERATTLAQQGQYARGLQALGSAGMAEADRETTEEMRRKHPAAAGPVTFRPDPAAAVPQLKFTPDKVLKAALSFRRGSAPGPSGLRPEHLRVVLKGLSPALAGRALTSLTKVVNLMAAGGVPSGVAPYLCGARLHAAKKKGVGIRPIAVGNLLRRLVGKLVSSALADKAAAYLSPHQLGVGIRGGCEAIVHAVRQLVTGCGEEKHVMQVDLINAFNLGDRGTALQEVQQHLPEMLQWVLTSYGYDSVLLFGEEDIIISTRGFHQGDPVAGLLFALLLQPIVLLIQAEVPGLDLNSWFYDDGVLVGTLEELQQVADILMREGPARGLFLSTAATVRAPDQPKSTVWRPAGPPGQAELDPLQRGIPPVQEEGIILLGAPIGSEVFVRRALQEKVAKVRTVTELLPSIQDPHTEYKLLQNCLGLPKVMFNLRAADTTGHTELLQDFDTVTRTALDRILGLPVTDLQWSQAVLPVSMGGLGLRRAEDHAAAAYATSYLASQPLVRDQLGMGAAEAPAVSLPQAVLDSIATKQGQAVTTEQLDGLTQKTVSAAISTHAQTLLSEQFTGEGSVRDQARLASLGLPHAGDWLYVVPSPALGLHLRAQEFTTAIKYRLGCPVYLRAGPCPACNKPSDVLGDHAMCCGSNGERIARHNALRDALFTTAQSAALGPVREDRFLLPGEDRRPADVLVPRWAQGRDAAWDVTVVHPLQQKLVARAATEPGHALTVAFDRKVGAVAEACRRQGIAFIPLAAESLGGWHEVAVLEINKLATALARHTGQDEDEACRHLFGRLSVLLLQGNGALFSNRFPDYVAPEISGQL